MRGLDVELFYPALRSESDDSRDAEQPEQNTKRRGGGAAYGPRRRTQDECGKLIVRAGLLQVSLL